MGRHFLPRKDSDFRLWTSVFADHIEREPHVYGLTTADAEAYRASERRFDVAYIRATTPATRTTPAVSEKDDARRQLEAETRRLVPIVRATLGPDATEKLGDLGLPTTTPRRRQVRVTADMPFVSAEHHGTDHVLVKLKHATAATFVHRRPRDAIGAVFFLHIGDESLPMERWPLVATSTRPQAIISPDRARLASMRSPRVWVTGCWLGPRLDRGKLARPVELAMVRPEAVLPANVRLAA